MRAPLHYLYIAYAYPYSVFIPYTSLCLHHNFNLLLIHVAIPKRHNDLVCRVMSMIVIYDYCPISEEYYLKEKNTSIVNLSLSTCTIIPPAKLL